MSHEHHPILNAETPVSPEVFKHQTAEILLELLKEVRRIRRSGNLPADVAELGYIEQIGPGMPEAERQAVLGQHELLMASLNDRRLKGRILPPRPVEVLLKDENQPTRVIFTRLTRDLALREDIDLSADGVPLRYRPFVWAGRDALEDFVINHMKDEDIFAAHD